MQLQARERQGLPATTRSWNKLPLPVGSPSWCNLNVPRSPAYHTDELPAPETVEASSSSFPEAPGNEGGLAVAGAGGSPET